MTNKNRKYLVTINNPLDHGLSKEIIIQKLTELTPVYFCYSEEIGLEEMTPHCHIFIVFKNPRSFNTIKETLTGCHIDHPLGTNQENKDYVFKEGKWLDDPKGETNIRESHYEHGELPPDEQGKRNDWIQAKAMIDDGMDSFDIIDEIPHMMQHQDKIENYILGKTYRKYKNEYRKVDVTFIFGNTEAGKSRYVFDNHGYQNVYRVSNYSHPFDEYQHEDVLVLDEYRGQFPISDLLNYIDGYPTTLPCRFKNKIACYHTVYLISNEDPRTLYKSETLQTVDALRRRIHHVIQADDRYHFYYFETFKDFENKQFTKMLNRKDI